MSVVQAMRTGQVLTPAEVAHVLRVDEETVRREIRRGRLTAVQVGRQYRLTASDLIGWLGQERYTELFASYEALALLLGSGGMGQEEAQSLAIELTRRARRELSGERKLEGPAPDEVRLQ